MEKKKSLIIVLSGVVFIVLLIGLYLLNDNEELKDLSFNQRGYLDEVIAGSNLDINKNLSSSERSIKDTYVNKTITINTSLEGDIKVKTDALLEQDSISTTDISTLRREMIIAADSYDMALAELSGEAGEFPLYTLITYYSPLNNYYYFDGIEGTYMIEVNYSYLYNVLKEKLTPATRAYCILKSEVFKYNNGNYLYKDGALSVTWDKFEEVLLLYDNYVKTYPDETIVNNEYNILFDIYIGITVLPNTPIYGYDGETVTTEVLNTYKDIIDNYKDFTKYDEVKIKYDANI
jgi:hypothetical protein